jgi:hypothetical protein
MRIRRDDSICKACLGQARKRMGNKAFLTRRLKNGFCIYNVREDGSLHPSLGDAARSVPDMCPFRAEQAVSHVTDEEVDADRSRELRDTIDDAVRIAGRCKWKFSEREVGRNRELRFVSPRGNRFTVLVTGLRDLIANEIPNIKLVTYRMTGALREE